MTQTRKILIVVSSLWFAVALAGCGGDAAPAGSGRDAHEAGETHGADEHGHDEEHGADGHDDEHGEEGHDDHEEGSTTIPRDVAEASGVVIETAGPAVVRETVALSGIVRLKPAAQAEVRAVYPGRVLEVTATVGDVVEAGDTLAVIENASSLQSYRVRAPISGTILERFSNPGDVATDRPLYRLADLDSLQAELHVFPRDAGRIEPGQPVLIRLAGGDIEVRSEITSFLPLSETETQSLIARADLPENSGFRPGMRVEAQVATGEYEVGLAVRESGVQRYRDRPAVFTRDGDEYTARPLQLGRSDGVFVEVLSGIDPGDSYVAENSFLILADIEKAGAGHNH